MGTTGSGKSTIAAYFGNYPIVGVKDELKGEIKIEGKGIAYEYGSCTEVPNEIKGQYKKELITIFDCPGFFDTKGFP